MIFTRAKLLNNPIQVAWFLANDEKPPYKSDIHQSIVWYSLVAFIVFLAISMMLQRNFGSFPGISSAITSLGVPVILAFLYKFISEREYRGKSVMKMREMIPEYDHWEINDKRALRAAFLDLWNDNDRVTDYPTQLRATYLDKKAAQDQKLDQIDNTLKKAHNE